MKVVSHWLVEVCYKSAGRGIPGYARFSSGSLMDRIIVQEILGLVSTHWQVKPVPMVVLAHWWEESSSGV